MHYKKETEKIGLPVTKDTCAQMNNLLSKGYNIRELKTIAGQLQNVPFSELRAQVFLQLDPTKVSLAFEPQLFGSDVDTAFPTARDDIEEASRCLAFDRGAACVFHLMKVLEVALYVLATDLKILKIEENWGNVIDQIDKAIKKFETNKPDKDSSDIERNEWKGKLEFYSDCATHFRYIKDAWRNHNTHVRKGSSPYSEEKAELIYDNVRGFMQSLATRLHEKEDSDD